MFVEAQEQQADAEGEQQEQQGRRVLGDVEEAHQDLPGAGHGLPGGVAVDVGGAQQGEAEQGAAAGPEQAALAQGGVTGSGEPGAEGVAQGDDGDPGQHGIGGAQAQGIAGGDPVALVQDLP
ncbi:hypothetical protein D9M71_759920 [compost metagenome]